MKRKVPLSPKTRRDEAKEEVEMYNEEEEEIEEENPEDIQRAGLPKAQLELEYTAVLQERELLLNQLAGLLEEKMVTIPTE